MRMFSVGLVLLVFVSAGVQPAGAQQVSVRGSVTVYTSPSRGSASRVDFVNAKPMPLPRSSVISNQRLALAAPATVGTPGFASGAVGTGETTNEVFLGTPVARLDDGVESQEYGTYNHPFNTARTDLRTGGAGVATNIYYPNRASGKLFFNIGSDSYVCSAALIKRGLVVTAAHCVASYGASQYFSDWQFVPGYRNGSAPFGTWSVYQAWVKTAYYNGSGAGCAVYGVVCPHDIAILSLNAQSGSWPGTTTGYYGYGWDGYGFVSNLTQITQIGYPTCLDSGLLQERNDSYGYVDSSLSNNTIIGSPMCGGSSGGPWLVNYGIRPTLTGTSNGTAPDPNMVVGVTSWGYTSTAPKELGASPFTISNIVSLVNAACGAAPSGTCL